MQSSVSCDVILCHGDIKLLQVGRLEAGFHLCKEMQLKKINLDYDAMMSL